MLTDLLAFDYVNNPRCKQEGKRMCLNDITCRITHQVKKNQRTAMFIIMVCLTNIINYVYKCSSNMIGSPLIARDEIPMLQYFR